MTEKSDAQATIEFAIRSGLIKNAHHTGVTANISERIVADVMEALSSPEFRWALHEYTSELDDGINYIY